jgi:hypothetical protein
MSLIGINPDYDYLYDRQQDKPAGFCQCGREIYAEGDEFCFWCMEDMG